MQKVLQLWIGSLLLVIHSLILFCGCLWTSYFGSVCLRQEKGHGGLQNREEDQSCTFATRFSPSCILPTPGSLLFSYQKCHLSSITCPHYQLTSTADEVLSTGLHTQQPAIELAVSLHLPTEHHLHQHVLPAEPVQINSSFLLFLLFCYFVILFCYFLDSSSPSQTNSIGREFNWFCWVHLQRSLLRNAAQSICPSFRKYDTKGAILIWS